MTAQHIKGDFHLTDEQLGFLLGPANIVFYVLVGIPLARLVDLYPRKYVLAGATTLMAATPPPAGPGRKSSRPSMTARLTAPAGRPPPPASYSFLAAYFSRASLRAA